MSVGRKEINGIKNDIIRNQTNAGGGYSSNKLKAEKVVNYIVPVGFLTFLIFLLVGVLFRFPNKTSLIGVTLASYPEYSSIEAMMDGTFQTSFGQWISDNFYGHTKIVQYHNQIEYSVFRDGSGDWIQGKDGYLFSRNQSYDYVSGERANINTWDEYLEYAQSVAELQTLLQGLGKDFAYLITPVKAEIYPDYLPWYLKCLYDEYADSESSKHEMLVRALQECGVNYVDVTGDLKAMRESSDFDVFSKTGHHWTLTAAATEMNTIFKQFSEMTSNTEYPVVSVTGITEDLFEIDKDIINLQNVIIPKLSDTYNSPTIEYVPSDDSVYMFGTSFGWEITGSLFQDELNKAFDNFTYEEYFTTVTTFGSDGNKTYSYTMDDTPDDIGIMNYIRKSDLTILEQNGSWGIIDTHKKFVSYVTEALKRGSFSLTGSLLRNTDASHFELVNFYGLEDWGRWTEGNSCSILIHDSLGEEDEPEYLEMRMNSFAIDQTVEVSLNGEIIDQLYVTTDRTDYRIELPKELLKLGDNTIGFLLSNETTSLKALGNPSDARILGLGFESLHIVVGGEN